jgi:dTMP kinase
MPAGSYVAGAFGASVWVERTKKRRQEQGSSVASRNGNPYVECMFITFEGLDCSGKTTQAQRLCERLGAVPLPGERNIRPVRFIREPGGTAISERLREILLDRANLHLSEVSEIFLFSASRAQLVREIIQPALARGEIVICDRYADSTTAYQGYGRGLDLPAVLQINRLATAGLVPDRTIVVDITVDEVGRRKSAAGMGYDRMESAGTAFYERVRNGYAEIARREHARCVVVNGMAPIETVEEEIWQALARR